MKRTARLAADAGWPEQAKTTVQPKQLKDHPRPSGTAASVSAEESAAVWKTPKSFLSQLPMAGLQSAGFAIK